MKHELSTRGTRGTRGTRSKMSTLCWVSGKN